MRCRYINVLIFLIVTVFSFCAQAAEPVLQFVSIPTVQPLAVNASETLTYRVRNNVPSAAIPINAVTLTPVSAVDEITSWTTSCNYMVPAGGTCDISVVLTAKEEGSTNQTLNIYYSDRHSLLQTPIRLTAGLGLTFTSQPSSAADMLTLTAQRLDYVIKNQSTTSSIVLGTMTFSPSSTSDHAFIRNSCGSVVAPEGSCSIRVTIFSTNQTGTVTQALNIPYTVGSVSTTLISNSLTFQVMQNQAILSFLPPLPTVSDMNLSGVQTLNYVVQNNGSSPVAISSASVTSSPYDTTNTTISNCPSNIVAANGGTCDISVQITANNTTTGSVSQDLQVAYGSSGLLTSPIDFNITSTPTGSISFISPQPLANDLNNTGPNGGSSNHSQVLTFNVENSGASPISVTALSITPASSLVTNTIAIQPNSACPSGCGSTLPSTIPAGCSCPVQVTIQAAGATNGTLSQQLSVTSDGTPSPLLSQPMIFAVTDQNMRNFTFVNECPFPVWMAAIGGGQAACTGTGQGNCPSENETCLNGLCTWNDPQPLATSSYKLDAASSPGTVGGVGTLYVPIPQNSDKGSGNQNIIWSGIFAARTGCPDPLTAGQSQICETGDCSGNAPVPYNPANPPPNTNPAGACIASTGFRQPAIQFEPTLANALSDGTNPGGVNYDNYDVTMVNGITVPIAAYPMNPQRSDNTGFMCGVPGSPTESSVGSIGGCPWSPTPPNSDLYDYAMIAPLYQASAPYAPLPSNCTTQADCSSGQTCGLALSDDNNFYHYCGPIIGYWNADQACSINPTNPTAPAVFKCNQPLTPPGLDSPYNGYQTTDLYACQGVTASTLPKIPSCYTTGSSHNACCGCVNWNNIGIQVGDTAIACVAHSTSWTEDVLPQIQWTKEACPSAYTYPYDDATSSYICSSIAQTSSPGVNQENYLVVYCPNGETAGEG